MGYLFVGSESLLGFYRFSCWVCEEEPGLAFGGGNPLGFFGNSSAPKIRRFGILLLPPTAQWTSLAFQKSRQQTHVVMNSARRRTTYSALNRGDAGFLWGWGMVSDPHHFLAVCKEPTWD